MTIFFAGTLDSPFAKDRIVSNQDSYAHQSFYREFLGETDTHPIYDLLNFDGLHTISQSDELFHVSAVADGAGSLELSHEGSEFATTEFITVVAKKFKQLIKNPDILTDALGLEEFVNSGSEADQNELQSIRNTNTVYLMQDIAESTVSEISESLKDRTDYRKYGTTFTGLITVGNLWTIVTVGDSFAVVENSGEFDLIQSPQDSEFYNMTELLTSTNYQKHTVSGTSFDKIYLASDGLDNASIDSKTHTPTESFWGFISKTADSSEDSSFIKQLFEYMNQQGKIDDDTTLLIEVANTFDS